MQDMHNLCSMLGGDRWDDYARVREKLNFGLKTITKRKITLDPNVWMLRNYIPRNACSIEATTLSGDGYIFKGFLRRNVYAAEEILGKPLAKH